MQHCFPSILLRACARGAAQVTCLLINGYKVYTAGAGANMTYVVGQDMWLDPLTVHHVPENPVERERVEASGAEVLRPALFETVRSRPLCV
jgi:serine/threonine protein phosphatase PrpC